MYLGLVFIPVSYGKILKSGRINESAYNKGRIID
jgi:hypothetical protein